MPHIAFSTVACPGWTLSAVAERARRWDFDGVELRTFGPGSTLGASDPCLSAPVKVRRALDEHGVALCGYGTGARFDEVVWPPAPLGWVFGDNERPVREFKAVTEHASEARAGYVRVFGFEVIEDEPRKRAVRRISERLRLVCDDARHQNVRIALENGGSFGRAEQVMEIVDRVNKPELAVCYSMQAAEAAGEDAAAVVGSFGSKLAATRIGDHRGGVPCAVGEGEAPCEGFVKALNGLDDELPLVIEWPAMWRDDIGSAEEALPASFAAITGWTAGRSALQASSL